METKRKVIRDHKGKLKQRTDEKREIIKRNPSPISACEVSILSVLAFDSTQTHASSKYFLHTVRIAPILHLDLKNSEVLLKLRLRNFTICSSSWHKIGIEATATELSKDYVKRRFVQIEFPVQKGWIQWLQDGCPRKPTPSKLQNSKRLLPRSCSPGFARLQIQSILPPTNAVSTGQNTSTGEFGNRAILITPLKVLDVMVDRSWLKLMGEEAYKSQVCQERAAPDKKEPEIAGGEIQRETEITERGNNVSRIRVRVVQCGNGEIRVENLVNERRALELRRITEQGLRGDQGRRNGMDRGEQWTGRVGRGKASRSASGLSVATWRRRRRRRIQAEISGISAVALADYRTAVEEIYRAF
nr:hypothetical protein Iba_chr11cCG7730 [Ipomoea batatas]